MKKERGPSVARGLYRYSSYTTVVALRKASQIESVSVQRIMVKGLHGELVMDPSFWALIIIHTNKAAVFDQIRHRVQLNG